MGYQDVVLLTASVAGEPRQSQEHGYRTVRRGGQFTVYLWALLWLARHRRNIVGVIDCQNGIPYFSPLVIRRRTPIVLVIHHVHQDQFRRYFGRMFSVVGCWLEGPACRFVYGDRAVAALSPSTRNAVRQRLRLRGAVHVVPPGSDVKVSESEPAGSRAIAPTVVCVGRLVPHKRFELIIEAWPMVVERIDGARLEIIGQGSETQRLKMLCEELGVCDTVTFRGFLPRSQRDALLQTAWLTVNASAGEGWGLSIIEANALGVPAVVFDVDGMRDSVRHGETGWVVPSGGSLAEMMIDALGVLADESAARQWARRARSWVGRFDWSETARLLKAILETERARLEIGQRERRHPSDLATVVRLESSGLAPNWGEGLRRTDRVVGHGAETAALLPGSDAAGVRSALARVGIWTSDDDGATPSIEVARPGDHVLPGRNDGLQLPREDSDDTAS